jgi:hypothetical protein
MTIQRRPVVFTLLIALTLVAALLMGNRSFQRYGEDAYTVTLYDGAVITETQTSPTYVGVSANAVAREYGFAYAHFTVDVNAGGNLAVTPQFSADNVNWATAVEYVHTDAGAVVAASTAKTLNADGTQIIRIPLTAPYLRFSIVPSGTVTTTAKVLYYK